MSLARPLLSPLVPLYRLGLAMRELRLRTGWEPVRRLRYPVISIGNLSAGGSGKTPLTIALAGALLRRGIQVDVLSRGYGRRTEKGSEDPLIVDPGGEADRYGDEPLLIARSAGVPVYLARQRYQAGCLAESQDGHLLGSADPIGSPASGVPRTEGASPPSRIHLLDDGFQHRQLARDVDIVLLSRDDWRDRLLPAGNLREPMAAIRRAHILAIPAEDPGFARELRAWGWGGPVWRLRRSMDVPDVPGPAIAFCGIARPRQFFAGLEAAGVPLAVAISYPDHHRYTQRNFDSLALAVRSSRAQALITTEKDAARLGPQVQAMPGGIPLHVARLRVEIEEEAARMDELLRCPGLSAPHATL